MTLLNLGRDKNNNIVKWYVEDNSYILIEGLPGTGKSVIGSMILSQLRHRYQLIFDYEGEIYSWLRQSPALSYYPHWWMSEIYQCYDPYFSFSQMSRFDLESLRLPLGGSIILGEIAKLNLSWKETEKCIEKIPTRKDDVYDFNNRFHTSFAEPISAAVKQGITQKFPIIQEIFAQNGEFYQVPELWRKFKYVTINFKVRSNDQATYERVRLFAGKFMQQVWDSLYSHSPVWYVDEASITAPAETGDVNFTSLDMLNKFAVLQRRRTGSMLIIVVQHEKMVSATLQNNYSYKIKGLGVDMQGKRWFCIGNAQYWKTGRGRLQYFTVHDIKFI